MLNTYQLDNGLKVCTYHLPQLKSFHMNVILKGGSVIEDPHHRGVAHFVEHMLLQGIPSFPNSELLSSFIEGLAGSYNAITDKKTVRVVINAPSVHLDDCIKILSEAIFSPLFPESSIEKERHAILNEITQRHDSIGYALNQFYSQTRYTKDNPYLQDVGGDLEHIKNIQRQDLLDYWQKAVAPQVAYILIVGNFDKADLRKSIEKYFAKVPKLANPPVLPKSSPNQLSDRVAAIRYDQRLQSIYFDLNWPSIDRYRSEHDRVSQNIAVTILGGLRTSRLYKLLRYQYGLVYSVDAYFTLNEGFGTAGVNFESLPEKFNQICELISQQLKLFLSEGPTDQEVSSVKQFLQNRWMMMFDHPSNIFDWIESPFIAEQSILLPEDYQAVLAGISAKTVHEFILKSWDFSKTNMIIQGAFEQSKSNQKVADDILHNMP